MGQAWPDRHCQNAGTRLLIFAVDSQATVQARPDRGSQVTAGVSAIRNTPISATPPAGIAGSAKAELLPSLPAKGVSSFYQQRHRKINQRSNGNRESILSEISGNVVRKQVRAQ